MKRTVRTVGIMLLIACTSLLTAFTHDIFSIPTVMPSAEHRECKITIETGQILEFNAYDLERRLEMEPGELRGVTITSLPLPEQGAIFLDGVELEPYEFITREELNRLCFVPSEKAVAASVTLLPQGLDAIATYLAITVSDAISPPPRVENARRNTIESMPTSGILEISGSQEEVRLQVVRKPEKGEVHLEGKQFVYEPFQGYTGLDSFTVCAINRSDQYSKEALVEVFIEPKSEIPVYIDMNGNPSAYAAYKLKEKKVWSGRQIGSESFFYPEHRLTRGEFLVMLLAATGMDSDLPPTVHTVLPSDEQLPLWLKPYIKKAIEADIWPKSSAFWPNEIPTRAEAVVMVHRASRIHDVKQYPLSMWDQNKIPDWAIRSYTDLSAYKMLDLHDGYARPKNALTNEYAADLLWQLWKHTHRD